MTRRVAWVLAVLLIAAGVVVAMATAAEAKQINSVAQLKESCAKGNGTFTASADGKSAICDVSDGTVVCNDNATGKKCGGFNTIGRLVPKETVRAPGVSITTQTVSKSRVFRRRVDVAVLSDVCAGLAGEFLLSVDGAFGTCGMSKATIICADALPGKNCTGVANKKANATCVAKQVDVAVRVLFLTAPSPPTPPSGGGPSTTSPSTTSPTTTSPTTTTTLSP